MSRVPRGYTGHARDIAKGNVTHDPRVEITPNVRILMRASDGAGVIFDKRLELGVDAGVYDDVEAATRAARIAYADEIAAAPVKRPGASDDEAFAGMRRALANGFATHEPAMTPAEIIGVDPIEPPRALPAQSFAPLRLGVGFEARAAMLEVQIVEVVAPCLHGDDCVELDCNCACHFPDLA